MNIESINLRKCIIEKLSEDAKNFVTKDLYDSSEKVVFLTGKGSAQKRVNKNLNKGNMYLF